MKADKGDKILASDINPLFNLDSKMSTVKVGAGLVCKNFPGGIFLDTVKTGKTPIPLIAKITDTGPDGQDDFDDYRYWCALQVNNVDESTETPDSTVSLGGVSSSQPDYIVAAINLSEYPSGTHTLLKVDDYVVLQPIANDKTSDPTVVTSLRFYISAKAGILKIRLAPDGSAIQVTYDNVVWVDQIAVADCTVSSGSSESSEG